MNLINLLDFRDPVLLPIYLVLLALAFSVPLFIILRIVGYTRRYSLTFFMLAPIAEEIVLRLILLTYLLTIVEPLTAILVSTVIYITYADLVYGPPFIAEALVTGILFGFVFMEFGIIPVLIAHFLYRPILIIW